MKALLLKIKAFIVKLFATVEDFLPIGIEVVNRIKTFIDSPAADIITAIIPGTVDDEVKVWLRQWLPVILNNFGGLETIIKLPHAAKNQIYLGIASEINQELTNHMSGREVLTYAKSVLATHYKYNENTLV